MAIECKNQEGPPSVHFTRVLGHAVRCESWQSENESGLQDHVSWNSIIQCAVDRPAASASLRRP